MYIYFRNTVLVKKYISRVFVGQASRKDAKTSEAKKLEQFDYQVDLNALVAATTAASDEVIPINVAVDQDKAWYNRKGSRLGVDVKPAEDQPAAYISVARTDKEDEAIRGLLLFKASPDKAVPNQINVDGAAYYCASNSSPIRMDNGSSYYLYYSYNIGVSSGGPITSISAGKSPFISGAVTALVTDRADNGSDRAALTGDTTMKTFIRASYEVADKVYFNKLYAAIGTDMVDAQLKLLDQGCTQFLSEDLNDDAHGSYIYLGYRSFTLNETAIRLKNTPEEKAAERESQMSQAIYDIVCTVGEPFKPEGFISEKYQIYYTPVVYADPHNKKNIQGVNLNDGTIGPEIYMYYATPYAAKEYNQRVINDPRSILSSMPNTYYSSPLTKIALAEYDRVPYTEEVAAETPGKTNLLRWEYVMQADSTQHIDLNEGAIKLDSSHLALDNRISMFVQREDGSVKPSAEITGGYTADREEFGFLYIVK